MVLFDTFLLSLHHESNTLIYNRMKLRAILMLLVWSLMPEMLVAQQVPTHYVYFADGRVEAYPKEYVKSLEHTATGYTLTLVNDSVAVWLEAAVSQVSDEAPEYPQFTAFKFDDKLNDQLAYDVDATVTADRVTASVGAIGKWLTPSFKMDKEGIAYVDGVEQLTGQSRLRFADKVVYTLGYAGHRRLAAVKVSDEVWSDPTLGYVEISLTADMLATNAPSGRGEGLENLVDNASMTYFHSTWSGDPLYEKLPDNVNPYITVALTKPVSALQFYYQGRMDSNSRNPYAFKVYASDDNVSWSEVAYFDESDGIPTVGSGVEYMSPVINAGKKYSYWKFEQTACAYKNYLVLSTFKLYEVTGDVDGPVLIEPARYAYRMIPLGRDVTVDVEWPTDYAPVPRIDIDIDGGEMVSSKDYYLNALITIQGQGVWPDFQDSVQIKGRGNSSWSSYPYAKNPYRLKFASSVKPFGLKKGKNWNLIAQAQDGSMMSNPMAMKIARMVGAAAANDVIPVDLYMNGMYRGSYIFTQKTGLANNSVDLEDESAAVFLELDDYFDETYRFRSTKYSLPVNVKEPDFSEGETVLAFEQVRQDFNRFETAVYGSTNFERLVDMEMLVRFMLVNELVLNTELGHPKSVFLYKENLNDMGSPYVFGPVWDFDWSYGYEGNRGYCTSPVYQDLFGYHSTKSGSRFFSQIWQSSEVVKRHYYALWIDFMQNHLQELIDFADDYLAYANSSFLSNAGNWGDGNNYAAIAENMKAWLAQRAEYIVNNLTPYDLDAAMKHYFGDVNTDGYINGDDRDLLVEELMGYAPRDFDFAQADMDANGEISISDVAWLTHQIDKESAARARQLNRIDEWAPDVEGDDDDERDIIYSPSRAATRDAAWSHTLTREDGLPGTFNGLSYDYTSPLITPTSPIKRLRFTVTESNTGDSGSGYVCFALAEFYLYDANGNAVNLTANNFSTNAQEPREGPLADIADGDMFTYFHSTWSQSVDAEHYIDIELPEAMEAFSFRYLSRNERTVPTTIIVSEGVEQVVEDGDEQTSFDGLGLQVKETVPGMEWLLTVSVANARPYIAFQMDLQLPISITVFDANTDLVPTTRLASHEIVGDWHPDDVYRIVAYSETNSAIADTVGTLFTLLLTAEREVPSGVYPLGITNMRVLDGAAFETTFADISTMMHVSPLSVDGVSAEMPYTVTYYTVEGKLLAAPRPGIVISRKVYADGRVEVVKKMYR